MDRNDLEEEETKSVIEKEDENDSLEKKNNNNNHNHTKDQDPNNLTCVELSVSAKRFKCCFVCEKTNKKFIVIHDWIKALKDYEEYHGILICTSCNKYRKLFVFKTEEEMLEALVKEYKKKLDKHTEKSTEDPFLTTLGLPTELKQNHDMIVEKLITFYQNLREYHLTQFRFHHRCLLL